MVNARAEAYAPATVANLGVGFDILGMAVDGAGDTVIAEYREEAGAVIGSIEGDGGTLPREAERNVASISAQALLNEMNIQHGVTLHIRKGLPSASGLGSSAASAVAATVAVNALLGEPLSREALLPACLEGEAAVSGYHADNVAPALFGGITLTNGIELHQIHRLPVPQSLFVALVTPDYAVPTSEARAALPEFVTLKQLVHQTGAVAELVHAIYRDDVYTIARCMEADTVIEPARAHLMPLLAELRLSTKAAGALALVISGAGPTLCAICDSKEKAAMVSQLMQKQYMESGYESQARSCAVLKDGATVLSVV